MKYIFLFLLIAVKTPLFCQARLSVEYEFEINLRDVMPTLDHKIVKQLTNNVAVYDYHFFNNASKYFFRESRKRDESIMGSGTLSLKPITFYKNFKDNVIYAQLDAEKDLVSVEVLVKDQQWKIEQNAAKIILGISCQKATKTLDGEEETAWFTPEIPISDGPADYYGLPGLILQVENKSCIITACNVKTNDYAQWTIKMPTAEKYLSSEEFNKRISSKRN